MKPFEIWQVVQIADENGRYEHVDYFTEFKEAREREATAGGYGGKTIKRYAVLSDTGATLLLELNPQIMVRGSAQESLKAVAMKKLRQTLNEAEIKALELP